MHSAAMPAYPLWSNIRKSIAQVLKIPRPTGRTSQKSCIGSNLGTKSSTKVKSHFSNGLKVRQPTSLTIASTIRSKTDCTTKPLSSGRVNRVKTTGACSLIGISTREVNRCANAFKKLGLKKGDRAAIYLPMIPELAITTLACAKLGIIHTVIFAGFSSSSIRDRVDDCGAKLVITADGGWRRGQILNLKSIVDEALQGCETVTDVVIVKRGHGDPLPLPRERRKRPLVPPHYSGKTHSLRSRGNGCGRHPLSFIHQRHHREAQGHYPYHRWLHDLCLPHDANRI